MAGLYDRIVQGSEDNVQVHNFMAVLALRAEGEINDAQAKTLINEQLATNLSGAEITDADAILAVLNAKATNTLKMRYFLKVDAANIILENGAALASETNWRNIIEI